MENKTILYTIPLLVSLFFNGYLLNKSNTLEKQLSSGANLNAPVAGVQDQAQAQPTYTLDKIDPVSDSDFIRGSKDADYVLVEYSDYECPFCKRFHDTMKQVMDEYGNKVAWVYRHYPLPFHQNAAMESEASECVAELKGNDGFWKFTDEVYKKTASTGTSFDKEQIANLAVSSAGVDKNKFNECLNSGKYTQKVKSQMDDGTEAGISGTPGTVIIAKNGKREIIPGALPYDQVKQIIDSLK